MECQPPQNIETEIRDEDKDDQEERFLSCEDLEECQKIQEILIKFSRAKPKNKSDLRKFLINIAASSTRLLVLLEDESIPKNQNRQKNDKKNEQIPRVTIQRISAGSLCIEPRNMSLHENNDYTMNDKTSGSTSSQCIGFLQENTTQTLLQKDEICNTQLNNDTEIVFECKNVEPAIISFAPKKLEDVSQNQLQDSEISETTRATIKDERLDMVKKEYLDDAIEKVNLNNDCETNGQNQIIPPLNSIHDSRESEKLSKTFKKKSDLKIHMSTGRDLISHSCEICGKKFLQRNKLEIHTKVVHNGRKLYQCDTRGKTFALKTQLARHINSIPIDLACDASRKTFEQKDYLINPIDIVHNGKKIHDRGTYGKVFRQKVGLKKHIESPRRSITHPCDSCAKTFKRKSSLKNHIDFVHKNLKHHQCDECQKSYSYKSALNLHMSTVHNGITYTCDLCNKIFTRKGYLKVHIDVVHMNNRKLFKCDECLKSFNYKFHLTSHIEYAHKGITHPCDFCRKVFTRKDSLKLHKDSMHNGITHTCNQCKKSYSSKTYLKLHIDRIHNGKKPNT